MKLVILGFCLPFLLAQELFAQNLLSIQQGYAAGEIMNPASIVKEEQRNHAYVLHNKQLSAFNNFQLNYARFSHSTASDKIGVGAEVYQQQMGDLEVTSFMVDYNYQLFFSNYNKLSLGLRFGAIQSVLNPGSLNPYHTDDFLLNKGSQGFWGTNGSFGARFTHQNFSAEMAIPQLLANKRHPSAQNLITLRPYLYSRVLYTFRPKHLPLTLEPQYVIYKEKNSPFSHQLCLQVVVKDFLKIYSDVRFKNSYKLGIGIEVNKGIFIGYNAQRFLINTQTFRGTNQEILLAYRFTRNKKKTAKELVQDFYQQPDDLLKNTSIFERNMNEVEWDSISDASSSESPRNAIQEMEIPDFSARISNRDQVMEFLEFRSILQVPFSEQKFAFNSYDEKKVEFVLVLGIFESQKAAVQYMHIFNSRFVQTSVNQVNKSYYVLLPVENDLSQRNLESIWLLLEQKATTYWMINY